MRTISANLTASLAKKNPVYQKKIELYRRVWGGSSYSYGAAEDITSELLSAGNIFWKLDNEQYGAFNLDNVGVTLQNDRNQWKQDNTKGHFTGDYLLNQSKIKISVGAELADGTFETTNSFIGYIHGETSYNQDEKTVDITLISGMSLLSKTSAFDLTTTVTQEVLGRYGGTSFETEYKGVAEIVKIEKAGNAGWAKTILVPKKEYSISNLDEKELRATITLSKQLRGTEYVYATYKVWYFDKLFEEIIEEFLTNLGMTNYSISDTLFNNAVKIYNDQKTTYFLKTGTKSFVDLYSTDGQIRLGIPVFDDFSDGDITNNPTWTLNTTSSQMGVSVSDKEAKLFGRRGTLFSQGDIITASTAYTGTWEITYKATGGSSSGLIFYFIQPYTSLEEKYYLEVNVGGNINLMRARNIGNSIPTAILGSTSASSIQNEDYHTFRITRNSSGNFNVYLNDSLIISATDTNYNVSNYMSIEGNFTADINLYIKYIGYYATVLPAGQYVATGNFISEVFDCSANVTSYDKLEYYGVEPANTSIVAETYSSDTEDFSSGNDAAGWVALDASKVPQSELKRYIKYRFTLATTDSAATPLVSEIDFFYSSKQIKLEIAALSGSYLDMIAEFAKISNYEFGFDADSYFFYRPRTSTSSILDIRSDTNLVKIENFNDGIDRVYNIVNAKIGDYSESSTAEDDSEPNSVTKYGERIFNFSFSLAVTDNMNISLGVSPTILEYTKTPRRRARVVTQFLPQLELGDKITLYYREDTALRQWKWGDMDVVWGQADLEYYSEAILKARLNFWDVEMRVEGIEIDTENWYTILNLVEVV